MKKIIFLFLVVAIVFSACEKDDICVQNPITPKLILRFYDKDAVTELKNATRFSAIATSKTDSLFATITADSIAIPLNPNTTQTTYTFKRNVVTGNIADNEIVTFTISYTATPDYVSRSCGYRIEFTDLNFTFNSGWIQSISKNTLENINNQRQAHVQVFH